MATNGKNILIYLDGSVIGGTQLSAERSNETNVNCEAIETASPSQGSWRNFIPGRKEWSVTVNWLVPAVANITELMKVGNVYTLTECDTNGNVLMTGSAICQTCIITATLGNLIQGSFSFRGTGPLAPPSAQ